MEITSGVAELSGHRRLAPGAGPLWTPPIVTDVAQAVESGGSGDLVSEVIDAGAKRRYSVALRLPERYRTDPDAMRRQDPPARARRVNKSLLEQVARVRVRRGPELINREDGQRRIVVMSNVRDRDLGSFVAEVQSRIGSQCKPAVRILHRVWRTVRKSGPRYSPPGDYCPRSHRPHFRSALPGVRFGKASFARGGQHPAGAGGRNRRTLDSSHESQSFSVHRLPRPIRCRHSQRRRAGELDRSVAASPERPFMTRC